MELTIDRERNQIRIRATGAITTTQEAMTLKKGLSEAVRGEEHATITVEIPDSFFLPSSVIGSLLQLAEIEHHKVELHAKQPELRESLKKLGLDQILGVRGG